MNASVKIYMMWRLAKQKWANRGNQTAGVGGADLLALYREGMAKYLTTFTVACLLLGVMVYTELLKVPSLGFVVAMFL
jgi:hypothetical protein